MAEVVGLAASILQIAGVGIKLSTTLYNFGTAASRADLDVTDIADDVRLTATALDSVGKVLEGEYGKSVVSKRAIQDAKGLIKRCEAVFEDIQELTDKRKGSEPGRSLRTLGRFSWPLEGQRVELSRRRLESAKNSLMLFLHVLQIANEQANGNQEKEDLEQEHEKIRELHQREQDSLKALQALESELNQVSLNDEENLRPPSTSCRLPTIDFMVNPAFGPATRHSSKDTNFGGSDTLTAGSLTSDSEGTMTDDGDGHLTASELAQCTKHIEQLLERLTALQRTFETATTARPCHYPRHKVRKIYRRFCKEFESELITRKTEGLAPSISQLEHVPPSNITIDLTTQRQTMNLPPMLPLGSQISSGTTSDNYSASLIPPFSQESIRSPLDARNSTNYPSKTTAMRHSNGYDGAAGIQGFRAPDPPSDNESHDLNLPVNFDAFATGKCHHKISPSRKRPKEDHSDSEIDVEGLARVPLPINITSTGRVSKAMKGLRVHACSECEKLFTRAEHLRRHQKNHGHAQVYCYLCGQAFFREDLLRRHLKRHDKRFVSPGKIATPFASYRDVNISRGQAPLPTLSSGALPESTPDQFPAGSHSSSTGYARPVNTEHVLPNVMQPLKQSIPPYGDAILAQSSSRHQAPNYAESHDSTQSQTQEGPQMLDPSLAMSRISYPLSHPTGGSYTSQHNSQVSAGRKRSRSPPTSTISYSNVKPSSGQLTVADVSPSANKNENSVPPTKAVPVPGYLSGTSRDERMRESQHCITKSDESNQPAAGFIQTLYKPAMPMLTRPLMPPEPPVSPAKKTGIDHPPKLFQPVRWSEKVSRGPDYARGLPTRYDTADSNIPMTLQSSTQVDRLEQTHDRAMSQEPGLKRRSSIFLAQILAKRPRTDESGVP